MKTMNLNILKTSALGNERHAQLPIGKISTGLRHCIEGVTIAKQISGRKWQMHFLLLLFLGTSVLTSCSKNRHRITIEGQLVEVGTGEPIRKAGVQLGLYESDEGTLLFPTNKIVTTLSTDENGRFFFDEVMPRHPLNYTIELRDGIPGYYGGQPVHQITEKPVNFINVGFNPIVELNLILDNRGGGAFDYFTFYINGNYYEFGGNGRASFYHNVRGFDTTSVTIHDFREVPTQITTHKKFIDKKGTIEFVIDLRKQ